MSGTDDFCEIVEKATNSHQDHHRHAGDLKEDGGGSDGSSNDQGQQTAFNPFANFAFGGSAVLVAAEPSGSKRKELKGDVLGKKARARKFEGLNFAILNRWKEEGGLMCSV